MDGPRNKGRPAHLEPCPACRSNRIFPDWNGGEPYGLVCDACGWLGLPASPADGEADEAIAAWNRECRQIAQARALGVPVHIEAGYCRPRT